MAVWHGVEFISPGCNFAIYSGCINKIPLNPPLQKGEVVGMLGLIEMLPPDLVNNVGS